MRSGGETKKQTVMVILGIGSNDIDGVSIDISSDCIDQATLNIKLPEEMSEDDALNLGEEGALALVGNGLFIVDRPRRYHLVGCVGTKDLTVKFRVSNLDSMAWVDLREKIRSIASSSREESLLNGA